MPNAFGMTWLLYGSCDHDESSAGWTLQGEHVLTGIPANRWTLSLPRGVCIDSVPYAKDRFAADAEEHRLPEALRIYGFEHLGSTLLRGETTPGKRSAHMRLTDKVGRILTGMGMYEIKNFSFVSPKLLDQLRPGMRVIVPFGAGNRRTEGIVLALEGGRPDDPRRKAVLAVLDEEPVLDAPELRLALWMRERYFCTVYDAARAMLPAGLYFSLQDRWQLAPGMDEEAAYEAAGRSERARKVLELLFASGGWADVAQIKEAFGTKDPNPALKLLRDKGVLTLETSASRGVGDKKELVATLDIPPEEAMAQVAPRRSSAPLRYAVTELLCAVGRASAKELCYFTGASNSTLRSLAKSGILRLEQREVYRRVAVEPGERAAPPVLNAEQQAAFDGLDALAVEGKPAAALLYGVTGSGKTQVYLRLIYAALERGRTAMVLVPEISLTPQLMRLFTSHFGDDIAVLHSSLRAGERYDEWKRIKSGKARVVVGTRSAVFAP